MNSGYDWYWEGNVVLSLEGYLKHNGWNVRPIPSTERREKGPDLVAEKDGHTLVVEAKGYPSKGYQHGERKGQPKNTNPATQARHWFAQALFQAILKQNEFKDAQIAIALPRFQTYLDLLDRTKPQLMKLGVWVYVINEKTEPSRLF
jgi:hypothetical protein